MQALLQRIPEFRRLSFKKYYNDLTARNINTSDKKLHNYIQTNNYDLSSPQMIFQFLTPTVGNIIRYQTKSIP